ncbi:hypothetical protein [Glycomyces tarimensis]
MASGGARNRSGPPKDQNSLRSADGTPLRVLPATPFNRAFPEFPLPNATVREDTLWRQAWQAPQAWAWIEQPWRWQTIALWVRRTAMAESDEAKANDINAMIRLADQIGMTPAGLKENGWTIGAEKQSSSDSSDNQPGSERTPAKNRFKVVRDDGEAA